MDQQNSFPTPEPALYIPPTATPLTPTNAAPSTSPAPQKKSKKGMVIGLIVGFCFLLTGGTYTAAYFGYITLPITLPGIQNDIIASSLEDWLDSPISETTTEVKLAIESRDSTIPSIFPGQSTSSIPSSVGWFGSLIPTAYAQATPFSIESIGSQVGLGEANLGSSVASLDILPEFFSLNSTTTAYGENTGGLGIAQISSKLDFTFGETKVKGDAEIRILEKKMYMKMNELSGVPNIDTSKMIGKWVETDLDEATSLVPIETNTEDTAKVEAEARQALQDILTIAQEKKIFKTKKNFGKEDVDGTATKHTSHTIIPENVVPFFEAWVAARKKANQDVAGAEDMLAELQKSESKTMIENMSKALTIDLWYDSASKRIKKSSVRLVIVPPAESVKFKDDQFVFTFSSTINSVGVKKTIETPSPTEPLETMFDSLITSDEVPGIDNPTLGDARALARDEKRKSDIMALRSGLALFYDDTNSYPTSLSQLAPTYMDALPTDPTSQQNYSYRTCSGNHFLLYGKLENNGNAYFYDDIGNFGEAETVPTCGVATGALPTNTNTATPTNTAIDPFDPDTDALTADTDSDGLEDFLEALYGTDVNKADTDGDGYKDGEEVDNGYNPNGPGKLSTN